MLIRVKVAVHGENWFTPADYRTLFRITRHRYAKDRVRPRFFGKACRTSDLGTEQMIDWVGGLSACWGEADALAPRSSGTRPGRLFMAGYRQRGEGRI